MDDALEDILDVICCPQTRVPLRVASAAEIEQLNARIEAGALSTVGGDPVREPLEGAFVREGDDIAYPIRDRIPILIVEEGLPLA